MSYYSAIEISQNNIQIVYKPLDLSDTSYNWGWTVTVKCELVSPYGNNDADDRSVVLIR